MKILILEDENDKFERVNTVIKRLVPEAQIIRVGEFLEYVKQISSCDFDLLIIDLIVRASRSDNNTRDFKAEIIEETRQVGARSYSTPAIVLTQYLESSDGELYRDLNSANINAIHYDAVSDEWEKSLTRKFSESRPPIRFDVVIVCALSKEAEIYNELIKNLGPLEEISGLMCRRCQINDLSVVIISCPRMGLVSSAVITAYAIDRFRPLMVSMSGICGGVPGEASIYDTLVSDVCHQHDAGKWSNFGFRVEHYDVQVNGEVRNALEKLIKSPETYASMRADIQLNKDEYPKGVNIFEFTLDFASTSSGSAVMAEAGKTAELTNNQRKLRAFDMEVYSLYEACRLSSINPKFFAVKSVVDDGGKNKGDKFHRVGCLLSAKFIVKALESGIVKK